MPLPEPTSNRFRLLASGTDDTNVNTYSVSSLNTTLEIDVRDTVRPSACAGHDISSSGCIDAWYIGETADVAVQTTCVDPITVDAYIQASAGISGASTQTDALTISAVEAEAIPALGSSVGSTDDNPFLGVLESGSAAPVKQRKPRQIFDARTKQFVFM